MSAAANLLVDEGLRMAEHPGIMFRDGATGRRAALASGPDVWEVVRAVKSARAAEPELAEDDVLAVVVANTGVPLRMVRTAVSYWARYPAEIDAEIAAADHAEVVAEDPALTGLPDEELLAVAAAAGRALVTANIKDFVPLDQRYKAMGRTHAGLVLVSAKAFPQDRAFIGALVGALDKLINEAALSADAVVFLRR